MVTRITPTSKQKRNFYIHTVVYFIAVIIMWVLHHQQGVKTGKWVYPLAAWPTAAWGLALIAHYCAIFRNYTDPGMEKYLRETKA